MDASDRLCAARRSAGTILIEGAPASSIGESMKPLYELALSIKASHRELDRRVNDLMSELGLTGQQADALYVIGKAKSLSLKELGELLIAEAGHPSRLVDRLVEAGYVERVVAKDDRRRVVLTLSATGRELHRRIEEKRQGFFEFAESLVESEDLQGTLHLFRELLQHSEYSELIALRGELEERSGADGAVAEAMAEEVQSPHR